MIHIIITTILTITKNSKKININNKIDPKLKVFKIIQIFRFF